MLHSPSYGRFYGVQNPAPAASDKMTQGTITNIDPNTAGLAVTDGTEILDAEYPDLNDLSTATVFSYGVSGTPARYQYAIARHYVRNDFNIVGSKHFRSTISCYGRWGSGKTGYDYGYKLYIWRVDTAQWELLITSTQTTYTPYQGWENTDLASADYSDYVVTSGANKYVYTCMVCQGPSAPTIYPEASTLLFNYWSLAIWPQGDID